MEIIGFVLAFAVGIIMGLIGGGGSILTLPILVYIMGVQAKTGTTYSLLIVGTTALVAGIQNIRQKQADFKIALMFGLPSLISVYFTRQWLLPLVPENIFSHQLFVLHKDQALMLLFACIMLLSAISMLRHKKSLKTSEPNTINVGMIILEGLFVGVITGLVGVGGGFLIIPALTLFARIPMKTAIGTSLIIIAINSAVGFIGDLNHVIDLNWEMLLIFTTLSVTGSFVGNRLAKKADNNKLKHYFAWFVLGMAIFIFIKELFFQ